MPKGGGAVRSIGEKFAANPVTGTGSLTIPIATSPGRDGFGPSLAIRYDSGAGNGPFGLGWQLSVPRIARKTDKGLPEYDDDRDVFVLSDSEDLVPVVDASGKVIVTCEGDEKIIRYRPRVEGSFARIERRVRADKTQYWRATTPDNVTSSYGASSRARIVNPHDPNAVFAWLLEKTFDDRGNVVLYEYQAEDLVGVSASAAEGHRLAGRASVSANRYLKRIHYGNKTPAVPDASPANDPPLCDFLFQVVFDYGDHDSLIPTPERQIPWPARRDPFSTYRSTFELRTYRLCRRVLMFHAMAELGAEPCLVASSDFTYDEDPNLTKLISATHSGYIRDPLGSAYTKKSLPAVQFGYQPFELQTKVETLDRESLEGLPAGLSTLGAQVLDLDGEGLPGVLVSQPMARYYKRNFGGRLRGFRRLSVQPVGMDGSSPMEFMDLDGDGRLEAVQLEAPLHGYQERTTEDGWGSFKPFRSWPIPDTRRPDARLIDLTGDGHEDLLIVERAHLVWYPSLAKGGYGPPRRIPKPSNEEQGPAVVLTDEVQTIFLADMSGDGLADLVRIRNGAVCYWPNLGFGRFGAKVSMAVPGRFDGPDRFDPRRVHLVDIDGSGTADLLYLHAEGARVYLNETGNSFASPVHLPPFPTCEVGSVQTMDLRGTGTACLVWSSGMPRFAATPLRFMDLTGGKKPHLLVGINNNLGLETRLSYASSTKFYLEDLLARRPWATKLPFPVHVLTRVESYEAISKRRFVSTYSYHHGFFDGVEREFRGFGRVEQRDAESFEGDSPEADLHVPPVLTKTWYHTGAWLEGRSLSEAYAREYYRGDPIALGQLLPDSHMEEGLSMEGRREATRALKGSVLRQEIYAEDGSPAAAHPYSVSERSYHVRPEQKFGVKRHGVFFAHPREAIDYHYEREPADPRISHTFTLEVGEYGSVTRSATVVYGRRGSWPDLAQNSIKISLFEIELMHLSGADTTHRLNIPKEQGDYELTGLAPSGDEVLSFEEVHAAATTASLLPYEAPPTSGHQKRLLSQTRHLYQADDLSGPLSFGVVESLALPYESYAKAFSEAQLNSVLSGRVSTPMLAEGGYVKLVPSEEAWWVPSGRAVFDAERFYLPVAARDPFGNTTTFAYDAYGLLVIGASDPVGNVVSATPDYRTLSPALVADPNGNRTEVRTDELGVVVAMAVMGKVGSSEGDTLEDPTVSFAYDLGRFGALGLPSVVHAVAREEHGPANTRFQHSYAYFDGAGLEVMRKVQAEPGLAPKRDEHGRLVHEEGELVWEHADPRWVGTGRTIWNNKGLPIRQYEPFFSATHEYETEDEVVESGVTPLFHYDPLGRLIRTDLPNGSYSKVEFGPWRQTSWDPNDTVFDPADPEHSRSAWYAARVGLPPGPEKRAATLTAAHAGTTTVAELDVLGREFRTTQDAGGGNKPTTTQELDIEGNLVALTDARGIVAETGVFAMGGAKLKQSSADAGTRWMLSDVLRQPLRRWDERGHALRWTYDALRRSLELFVAKNAAPEVLAERTVWGEGHFDALAKNLRGRPFQSYDGAGVVTSEAYDFKGNPLAGSRRLRSDYAGPANWPFAGLSDIGDILAAAEASLELESFGSATTYDALNRPTSLTTPDASEVRPSYNEAGLLEAVDLRVRDDASWTSIVDSIDYDAKGRRERIVYGNGTRTECSYDPETFRLTRLKTLRDSDSAVLQDVRYTYDPIGNIVAIEDAAQQTVFFDNAVVTPSALYEYDSLYRLISATGREHAGGMGDGQRDQNDLPISALPHFNDAQALRNYTERYTYDAVGNILRMIHEAGMTGSWTRGYRVASDSNRLLATSLTGDDLEDPADYSATYTHDAHGNMVAMPHLEEMGWDYRDQMVYADKGGGGEVHFTYDAAGQRVRKVWEHSGLIEERIYLGAGYEVYRRRNGSGLVLERQTLHLMDGEKRVAMVETKTVDTSEPALVVTPRLRYQLGNHLGSALLEVDETGRVISYEEYHPYGSSAYRSARSGVEVSAKRYRYTGKERDEETSLYYHGARYYAAWLGRWTAADPAGMVDGPCLYAYVRGNPVRLADPSGREAYGFGSASGIDAIDQVMARGPSGAPAMGEPRFTNSEEDAARPIRASDFEASPRGSEFGSPEHIDQIKNEALNTDVIRGQEQIDRERNPPEVLDAAEAMAEVHNFGDRGGPLLGATTESVATWGVGKAVGLVLKALKGTNTFQEAAGTLRTLRSGVDFKLEGSLGLDVAKYAPVEGLATSALPAARQIEAAWGAGTYRHGGLMTGMEHIMYRHSAGSGFANVSRFAQGTTARNIVGYADDALRYGMVTPNGASAYTVEHNFGKVIGTNIAGDAANSIRVFVRNGIIQTAFPF